MWPNTASWYSIIGWKEIAYLLGIWQIFRRFGPFDGKANKKNNQWPCSSAVDRRILQSMAEGNSKLPDGIMNKKLEQFEKQNAELIRENAKLKEEIVILKKEKLQISIPIHHWKRPLEEGCDDLVLKDDGAKKSKQFENGIPNWFLEALDWIKRTELAQSSLSYSSKTFNQICFPKLHGNVKPHNVQKLEFSHSWDEEGNSRSILRNNVRTLIPIASINPPEYITGFDEINFCFIDGQALKFVQAILSMLNDVSIELDRWRGNDARLGPIDRLMALLGPKTFKLKISAYTNGMDYLDEELPGLLNNVRSVWLDFFRFSDVDVLSNWLATPSEDGLRKLLEVLAFSDNDANNFIDQVKQEFIDSEEPTNFIVSLNDAEDYPSFRIENERTDEILEFCEKQNSQNRLKNYYLIRHRKGEEMDKMDWEEEFEKALKTNIEIKLIGDLLESYDL